MWLADEVGRGRFSHHRPLGQSLTDASDERTLLGKRLRELGSAPTADALLDAFLSFVAERGLSLYGAQEEAILACLAGQNVILNTPTGSGKSLVATALHFFVTAYGGR